MKLLIMRISDWFVICVWRIQQLIQNIGTYITHLPNAISENSHALGVFHHPKKKEKKMNCFDTKCSSHGVSLVPRYFSRYLSLTFWLWVRYNSVYGIFPRFSLWNFNCDIFLFINNVSIICFKRNVFPLVYPKLTYIYFLKSLWY